MLIKNDVPSKIYLLVFRSCYDLISHQLNAVQARNELGFVFKKKLDRGSIRSSPRYGLSTPYRSSIRNSAKLFHQVLAFGLSCTELVYPKCWHFDNASKIDDVLTEHGGLLHVLPLAVCLSFFCGQVGGTILNLSYYLTFFVGPLFHA